MDGIQTPAATRWAEDVLDAEDNLSAESAQLADLLHQVIGGLADDALRRRLLLARRQVFNNVLPNDLDALRGALEELRPDAAARLGAWAVRRRALAQIAADGEPVLTADTEAARSRLLELADDPTLRRGIQLASPALDQQLVTMAAPGSRRPTAKRLRKVERSLLSYLARTACKTSPFSTMTGVAAGELSAHAEPARDVPGPARSYARINVTVITRLADAVLADLGRRADLEVTLSPGWRDDGERLRYVRHWMTAGDDEASVSFDSIRDGLYFLRRSGTLDALTGYLNARSAATGREIVTWLHERTDAEPEQCEQYLTILLDLGMLALPGFQTLVHTPEPLRGLQRALERVGTDWAEEVAADLDGPISLVAEFPVAGLDRRREILAALRELLFDIIDGLGGERSLPRTILYEDVRLGDRLVTNAAHPWRDAFGTDLEAVERLIPAYDVSFAHRLMLLGFFVARFGRGGRADDLLRVVEDFHEDLYDQYSSYTADRRMWDGEEYVPEENWLGRHELGVVDDVRRRLSAHVRDVTDGGGPEVFLDPAVVGQVGDELDAITAGPRPLGHFAQVVGTDDRMLVLNQSFGGPSFPFSRFTQAFDGLADGPLSRTLRAAAGGHLPEGAVFAEVTGGPATSNLNLHSRLTDYVIVCPGESSDAPSDEQIPLDDLYLVHDARRDRLVLRSRRLEREVVPVYNGYLVPMALPQVARTLLLLSPTLMVRFDIWGGVPRTVTEDGVSTRPRVRLGSVVLSRRSWAATAADLPLRTPGQSDADWFLGWHRWRRRHDVPLQTFVTVYPVERKGAASPKPQYLDLASVLSLQAFEAMITDPADKAVVAEMLPGPDDLTFRSESGQGHVTEIALETFRTDDPHQDGEGR
ncbi:lantibiotic dehydratase [Cellulosimicrobium sp. PMB13]|uniref:lantibiotic dehydratase n=1 Tax=Cellulosimicrobium sp. PMB13 TaxID=3120158 RepID=UPI003F4C3BD4